MTQHRRAHQLSVASSISVTLVSVRRGLLRITDIRVSLHYERLTMVSLIMVNEFRY
jgi:hypothetical protein